jgi:hypothetical protein
MAKTKLVMSARTKKVTHSPASKHIVEKKGRGGKRSAKKVMVKC